MLHYLHSERDKDPDNPKWPGVISRWERHIILMWQCIQSGKFPLQTGPRRIF
jgi:hypothetical protein